MNDQQFQTLITILQQIVQSNRDLIAAMAQADDDDGEEDQAQSHYDLAGRKL